MDLVSPGRSSSNSHTNYRFCNTPEKLARLTSLHHVVSLQKKELDRLKDRINQQIECGGVSIDEPVHDDLVNMMKDHTDKVLQKHGEDSFLGIFWSQQRKTVASIGNQVVSILTTPIQ